MHIAPVTIVLVLGLLIGVAGHIVSSRTMVAIGIALIGLASVYFGFFVAKVR